MSLALLAILFSVSTYAQGKFEKWPEIKTFHGVMSETFHPSEEGNLEPIKKKSGEMAEKAKALASSKIPAEFNNPEVNAAVKKLAEDSKALDKLVKSKASDKAITMSLLALHETFHTIVEKCSPGDHKHEGEGSHEGHGHGHEGHKH